MNKKIIVTASLLGMLAVITGAFGAHGLKAVLQPSQLEVWHTAVQYNFYHVFALLFLSTFKESKGKLIKAAYYLFTFGIIFFSGSLYLLSCRSIIGWSWLIYMGPVTPLGGLLFILGWLMMAIAALGDREIK
ncbi:DUF423 domain-containing protein [Mucilaginibacter sp. OK283]|jgi:uncharacterized membrane protein YgdD (TMEM256/DUF423 family)|uniref:DUF423 domain-containing protein n=1 Tax=Mucilaginibacter sp. OK283 TaxID=1881049 RepID=UPI0008C24D45|nr:DUF423 domain-containing protein [Mucilaginibacter sp. OK283]SEP05316.1 Uncharacterized membrane protein YgdD, TMEM256/DUF423 family [Mucilaginibacter sp. OK283]